MLSLQGLLRDTLASVTSSGLALMMYTLLAVVPSTPFWDPQYAIPLLGMILSHAMRGISIAITTALTDFANSRDAIELMLSVGASRYEATRSITRRAVAAALTPLSQEMGVAGLVTIPGLMSGYVLAGGDPVVASRYQTCFMFCAAAVCALGSLMSVQAAALHVVDGWHR